MSPDFEPTLDNLVSDLSFRQWVSTGAFRQSHPHWSQWLAAHPEHRDTVRQAMDLLLATKLEEIESDIDSDVILAGTMQKISRRSRWSTVFIRWQWVAAAASVVIFLTIAWFRQTQPATNIISEASKMSERNGNALIIKENTGNSPQLITLPDSSSVMLLAGSTLRFPAAFDPSSRVVYLVGEAFFEVTKRPEQPFVVQTRQLSTRVLGTSFNVRAMPSEPGAEVVVKTGRVAVYPKLPTKDPDLKPIVVLPDQHLKYDQKGFRVQHSALAAASERLPVQRAQFEFTDAPVTAVLDSIASVYGLSLSYNAENLKECILTTSLTDVPLAGKLNIICKALNDQMTFELSGSRVQIRGPGCADRN